MIKPTGKGKRLAQDLTCVFACIRKELFLLGHRAPRSGERRGAVNAPFEGM